MARWPDNPDSHSSHVDPEAVKEQASVAEDRWLDMIADVIVDHLLEQESK